MQLGHRLLCFGSSWGWSRSRTIHTRGPGTSIKATYSTQPDCLFPSSHTREEPKQLGHRASGKLHWPILGTALCCFQQMQSFLHGCASMHATQRAPVVLSIAGHASLQLAMPSPKPWAKGCRLCWVAYGLAAAKVEQNNYLQVSRASTYQLALQHTILLVVQNVLAMCATLSALW